MNILVVAMIWTLDLSILQVPPNLPCVLCLNGETQKDIAIPEHCTLFYDSWLGFSENRDLCFKHARSTLDPSNLTQWWFLRWDADYAGLNIPWRKIMLYNESYDVVQGVQQGQSSISPIRLLVRANWTESCFYEGVTHEYLKCPQEARQGSDVELSVVHMQNGYSRQDKLNRDIALIELDLAQTPSLPRKNPHLHERYLFFLATSRLQRDGCVQSSFNVLDEYLDKHRDYYAYRFYLAYQKALCVLNQTDTPFDVKLNTMVDAWKLDQRRWEPIYFIAELYRVHIQFKECVEWTHKIDNKELPAYTAPFLNRAIYEFGLIRQRAVCLLAQKKTKEAQLEWAKVRQKAPAQLNEWFDKYFV